MSWINVRLSSVEPEKKFYNLGPKGVNLAGMDSKVGIFNHKIKATKRFKT